MRDPLSVSGKRYFAAADILRIVCILFVAWFHIWQQSWLDPSFTVAGHYVDMQRLVRRGYMLVDLTLLLTGYLLYYPIASHEGRLRSVWGFYRRRLCRIVPSYLLAVAVAAVFAAVLGCAVGSPPLRRDLLTHLTFTYTFSMDSYYWTSLNAALWTVAVEMQFYLIFPLLARAFGKRPYLTCALMTAAALLCRWGVSKTDSVQLLFNQLPCMLDMYALGMLSEHLAHKRALAPKRWLFLLPTAAAFVGIFWVLWSQHASDDAQIKLAQMAWRLPLGLFGAAFLYFAGRCPEKLERAAGNRLVRFLGIFWVLWSQHASDDAQIKLAQMAWRLPLGLFGAAFLYFAGRCPEKLDRVAGNRLVRFLGAISYNFYIWHQYLAVKLKEFHIPAYTSELPQMTEGTAWQQKYTLCCFTAALLLSALLTYGFEKPMAKVLMGRRKTENKT